jgi:hypothetical protein
MLILFVRNMQKYYFTCADSTSSVDIQSAYSLLSCVLDEVRIVLVHILVVPVLMEWRMLVV